MPVIPTPDQATAKWVSRLSASTPQITTGVNAVTVAPGQLAAAQSAKWLAKVTAAQNKWKARVGSVPLSAWQSSMINVGIPRIAQGAQAKQGKFTTFMSQFLPYLARGQTTVHAMPNVTLEDAINRAVAMIRYNAAFVRPTTTGP